MARLRYNGLTAALGAPLAAADTTITLAGALTSAAGSVPTIAAPDYIPLTILTTTGAVSEIVYLTAYTSGATSGTIARGKEGTTAGTHASGDTVVNAGTVNDSNRAVGAQAYNNVGTSIANNSEGTIPLPNENFDTDGFHDNVTNNSRFTVPTGLDGYYLITAVVQYSYNATGGRTAAVFVNGAKVGEAGTAGSVSSTPGFTYIAKLVAGDYVQLGTYQDSGGSLALNAAGGATRLTMVRVGV